MILIFGEKEEREREREREREKRKSERERERKRASESERERERLHKFSVLHFDNLACFCGFTQRSTFVLPRCRFPPNNFEKMNSQLSNSDGNPKLISNYTVTSLYRPCSLIACWL